MRAEDRYIIERALISIRKETKEYIEESEFSHIFNAKVLSIFELVLDRDEIEIIAINGFKDDLIDAYVDRFESS